MTPASVLIVGNFASSWSGTTAVCEGLDARLQERGWRVFSTSREQSRARRLADMLAVAWENREQYRLAVVELYSGPAFVWAEAVCSLLTAIHKPYVLWLHGGNLPEFASHWRGRVDRLFARSSAVVAQSGYLADIIPHRRDMVRLIPNPLDLPKYPFRPRVSPEPRLAWLRSFHEIYNPSLAIEVAGRLVGDFPTMTLSMIGPSKGDGSLERAQALAEHLGLEDAVRFQGGVPKASVPSLLSEADVFLNTTNIDNTPVSVQEAMACGLCVVSTNVGGVPHLVRDGTEGLLVPARDAAAMTQAVRRVLTEPDLAGRMSSGARSRVEPMDWPKVVDSWERLLSSVGLPELRRP